MVFKNRYVFVLWTKVASVFVGRVRNSTENYKIFEGGLPSHIMIIFLLQIFSKICFSWLDITGTVGYFFLRLRHDWVGGLWGDCVIYLRVSVCFQCFDVRQPTKCVTY